MASSYQERRLQQQHGPETDVQEDARDQQLLEGFDEGMELAPEQAGRVAAQFGNAALAGLIGSQVAVPGAAGVDLEEEETIELVEEVGEELEDAHKLDSRSYGGGGPSAPVDDGNSGDGDSPWDVGHLFGGEDDDEDPHAPTRTGRLPRMPRRKFKAPTDDPFADGPDEGELQAEDIDGVDKLIGDTQARSETPRDGDAVYRAVEDCLTDPRELGRRILEPEDLVGRSGATDPVGRPIEIGRFLADCGHRRSARVLGRVLAGAAGHLFPDAGGFSGGVARMCSLAVCAEALEGGRERTDRAVAVSLAQDTWPRTVSMARPMAQQGRLHAPDVLDALIGGRAPSVPAHKLPPPSVLGARGLIQLLPPSYVPEIPSIDLDADIGVVSDDPELAELDAVLAFFATGRDATADAPDRPIPQEVMQPALHTARYLMNAAGKAHVEMAAAAFAVSSVRPGAPVRGPLEVVDGALARIARAILRAGRKLEKVVGNPRDQTDPAAVEAILNELREARQRLVDLRHWAFETVAGALDA